MKNQIQNNKQAEVKIFLYNPGQKMVYVRDLDIKVKPGETIDIRKYNKNIYLERINESMSSGSLRDLLKSGFILVSHSDKKLVPEYSPYTESKKPISRRQLLAPLTKQQSSNFIERLQQDFSDRPIPPSEHEVAKNTENLINSVDFEGFDDPLE